MVSSIKIAIILGTRPEIIKMSPIIRACGNNELEHYILHTGQHYSFGLDRVFFDELYLPAPKYQLDTGSGPHGEQTGKMLTGIEQILLHDRPDIVLVQGDTNTVLAGALAASKLNILVGHIEAGLRSFDRTMPEEINRLVTDHIADFLFAPTVTAKHNLLTEGINEEKIYMTGNTIADAVHQHLGMARNRCSIMERYGLLPHGYFLATVHRAGNTDNKERLSSILEGFGQIAEEYSIPVIFPVHPRTLKKIQEFHLTVPGNVEMIDTLGYMDFLSLESKARLILTDSGGVQEEACILKVPCVTLRENTERPETVELGANMITGCMDIPNAVRKMLKMEKMTQDPYGNGKAAERILDIITRKKACNG